MFMCSGAFQFWEATTKTVATECFVRYHRCRSLANWITEFGAISPHLILHELEIVELAFADGL